MKGSINCIVEFHLNAPLKDGSMLLIDDHAKMTNLDEDNIKVSTHYVIPMNRINSITVSFVEGYNSRIIINSGRQKIGQGENGVYEFAPPKAEYHGTIFENVGVEKHLGVRQKERNL